MNISGAAELSGLPVKTLRYYEEIGLVRPRRNSNRYRNYSDTQVQELVFLRRARQFGFSLVDCEQLLGLYRNPARGSHDVHQLARGKLATMDNHIRELLSLRDGLSDLLEACANDGQPECAILNGLAEPDSEVTEPASATAP